jgi:predicted nuclease of predicted toxin-antitoxin system
VTIWIDAQLSPALAARINRASTGLATKSVPTLGLCDATDAEIFFAARSAGAVIMSKDSDFLNLLDAYGPPPQVIWITCGNTSNAKMRAVLQASLTPAITLLQNREPLVEIRDR